MKLIPEQLTQHPFFGFLILAIIRFFIRYELLLHPENPLKYWERRDVVALDEARLAAGLNEAVSQRYDMPSWVAYGFDAEKAAAPVHGSAEAKAIVAKLNEKRPWVTKDPRMSLVASIRCWMPTSTARVTLKAASRIAVVRRGFVPVS